ncbi:MAG: transposase [bacterium]
MPGLPHHVTQRGNRRLQTFFNDDDYHFYKRLLSTFSKRTETSIIAWCLMPNHVHVIAVPKTEEGLRATFAPLHRTYSQEINQRQGWTGHLWQQRFSSVPLDEPHTIAAVRYVELNPVRAGLVSHPADYKWSSVRAHLNRWEDGLTDLAQMGQITDDWAGLLASGLNEELLKIFRVHETNGMPIGSESFLNRIGSLTGRRVTSLPRGGARR